VFLLEIDEPTMLARLDMRQGNEWGRAGDSREYLRRLLPGYQDRLCAFGAIPVDARQPIDQVVAAILATTASLSRARTDPALPRRTRSRDMWILRQRDRAHGHEGASRDFYLRIWLRTRSARR